MPRRYEGDRSALGRFERFLTSAIATVVLVRAFLIVTGYPKVGGGGLHIAHVLWGGLLMGIAIVMVLVHPGTRSKLRAALIGGIGFGLFIDEVGKFLTKDVNYFFQPAIAIIYVVFIAFYLVVRDVVLRRSLTDQQRVAIAATAMTDLALGQLSESGRQEALALLAETGSHTELVTAIGNGLSTASPHAASVEGRLSRGRDRVFEAVRWVVTHRHFRHGLIAVVALQAAVIFGELALLLVHPSAGSSRGSLVTTRAAEISAAVSGAYTLFGVVRLLRGNRAGGLRVLFRSVLVTLFVTQVFVFAQYQASGVAGLTLDLVLLGLLHLAGQAEPGIFHEPVPPTSPAR